MRVVSLTCSNTEIVCALGCAHYLVGVDDHSDYPQEVVTKLPRVGPDLGIDVQRVAALCPDLVLASLTVPGHEQVIEQLTAARLPFIAPEPVSLADVYLDIELIAQHLGVRGRGAAWVAQMRRDMPQMQRASDAPRLLVEWWPKPVIVPGHRSWVHDMIELAGGQNPFASRSVKSTPISDDEAVQADPDAVVISWRGIRLEKYRPDVVYRRPAWQSRRRSRDDRFIPLPRHSWAGQGRG